jgi:predicted RNA-binding protein with PUA-like domain
MSMKKRPARKRPANRSSTKARPATTRTKTKAAAPRSATPLKSALPPRRPGEVRYWLMKSEPDVFSFDDLLAAPGQTTCWDGVRNYTARNYMRDHMAPGDGILYYHSGGEAPAIAGLAEVASAAYPDHTAFDPTSEYHDGKSDRDAPAWMMVDVKAVRALARPVTLDELREVNALTGMELLKKGNRLSVQAVRESEWKAVLELAER